jgi:uridine monophosphate synthetase
LFQLFCSNKGVQINETLDGLGQQYTTPEKAICEKKCDIIIVGRGILNAQDQVKTAINYKNLGYNAYLKRLENN